MLTFLELGKYGRFGNQLFQVASTIGIAEKNNMFNFFPEWDHPFATKFPKVFKESSFTPYSIPWGYKNIIIHEGDYSLHGYLQSYKYFEHCKDFIKELFTFKEQLEPIEDFISVHVRRGDYTKEYYTILGSNYYYKALATLPDLPVYVFTDDLDEAMRVIPTYDKIFSGDTFYDLNLMTHAKYSIIANSSYSWWGAWLSNAEKIIAPKSWFGPQSPFNTIDMIPPNWIKI